MNHSIFNFFRNVQSHKFYLNLQVHNVGCWHFISFHQRATLLDLIIIQLAFICYNTQLSTFGEKNNVEIGVANIFGHLYLKYLSKTCLEKWLRWRRHTLWKHCRRLSIPMEKMFFPPQIWPHVSPLLVEGPLVEFPVIPTFRHYRSNRWSRAASTVS